MAISHDRILQEVFGRTTNVPVNLGSEPWSGYISHAKRRVDEIRKWYVVSVGDGYVGGADSDDAWVELIELEVAERLIRQFRSVQDADTFRKTAIASLLGQIVSTIASDNDWSKTASGVSTTTAEGIRKSVIDILVRQPTPVFPSIDVLDKAIVEEHVMLWDSRKWRFRRKPIKMTLATTGSVSASTDMGNLDGFASKIIYLKDSTNNVTEVHWKDSTRWAELMAHYDGESTGKPRYFYLQPGGSSQAISWFPSPIRSTACMRSCTRGVMERPIQTLPSPTSPHPSGCTFEIAS